MAGQDAFFFSLSLFILNVLMLNTCGLSTHSLQCVLSRLYAQQPSRRIYISLCVAVMNASYILHICIQHAWMCAPRAQCIDTIYGRMLAVVFFSSSLLLLRRFRFLYRLPWA